MNRVLTSSNRFLMRGGRWLTREYVPPPPPPPTRYVYINQSTGGTISASPMSGHDGDTVTLSNTPDTNYTFNGYSVNGATLYDGNKFDFSGSDVTCSASWTYVPPQPTWVELVNKEGEEWTLPKPNVYGIGIYIGDKMAGGTSYRYVTLKGDVKFNPPGTSSIEASMEYSLDTIEDDYMYWRVRWTQDSNYIGAVGIYGGVTAFTPASSTVRTFVSDGITYYYKTSWTRSSNVFKNVKQVYDTQNNTCELYIDDRLWGTATVNYSPHSIYGARIGYRYGEEGDRRGLSLKNLKAAAFQNLADARAY